MKRNTLTAWLLGIILIFSATSCFNDPIVKGSKNYITKKENLEHFNDISMSGSANITYQQDSSSRIEIYGSDNIVELLETKVNGETLNIKFKKNVNIIDKGKLEIKVFSPDLNRLTLNGSGGILFANGIHTKGDLKVTINGSGNLGGSTSTPVIWPLQFMVRAMSGSNKSTVRPALQAFPDRATSPLTA